MIIAFRRWHQTLVDSWFPTLDCLLATLSDVRAYELPMIAGELQMDLSGAWAQSATITIVGGVGKVTLHLPSDVGVRVEATAGLGRVNANGLSKEGDTYVNAAYATATVALTITVKAGVGEVNLELE